MTTVIVLLPRRADLSREEFRRPLEEEHLPLVQRLPGLRRLVVNDVMPGPDGAQPAYDAVAEDWFNSPEVAFHGSPGPGFQRVIRWGMPERHDFV